MEVLITDFLMQRGYSMRDSRPVTLVTVLKPLLWKHVRDC